MDTVVGVVSHLCLFVDVVSHYSLFVDVVTLLVGLLMLSPFKVGLLVLPPFDSSGIVVSHPVGLLVLSPIKVVLSPFHALRVAPFGTVLFVSYQVTWTCSAASMCLRRTAILG